MKYPVNDVYGAIQGEGCNTGIPMAILRLHGCPVGCPFCDTKETWDFIEPEAETLDDALGTNGRYVKLVASQIAFEIKARLPAFQWVLLTGGEPALYDLKQMSYALHDAGLKIAIETSGTAVGHLGVPLDWIAVSPKIGMPGGLVVLPEAVEVADEIKFVVGRQADIDKLDALLETVKGRLKPSCQICLQPISQADRATALCIKTVQERGYRLSLQLHKYIAQR